VSLNTRMIAHGQVRISTLRVSDGMERKMARKIRREISSQGGEPIMKKLFAFIVSIFFVSASLPAQTAPVAPHPKRVPIYRVQVVARTIKAINYRHRSGETKVDFRGTTLLPDARGGAEVQSKQGTIKVDAWFKRLQPASRFGPEYMTYVLWAISPEGRPVNLGEVLPDGGGSAHLEVTSDLQSFGLIVTAEPHFAVTKPSDVVVMENFVTKDTNGTIEQVDAKYELLKRGQYTANVNPAELTPMPVDGRTPIDIYEARNAVRIARWAGAETYAADTFRKAELDLQNAQNLLSSKRNRKESITDAREAAQMAEDARVITQRKMEAEEQARVQQNAAEASARAQAEAESARQASEQAKIAVQQKAQADAAKESAEAQADVARKQAVQAEADKAALRAKLQQQLNAILETRDTARGLIMNMSDVLFETGRYTLKPVAREKLAKVSGILISHPGLTLEIDGYTDSRGGDEFNQTLSEERASSVRDYLAAQGVPADSITAKGFGKTNPVASNDTAQGRQQNRRVELVVSGGAIRAELSPAAGPR
jgi:outer membrane protein OmpA-like peptidoglycan-associated protein